MSCVGTGCQEAEAVAADPNRCSAAARSQARTDSNPDSYPQSWHTAIDALRDYRWSARTEWPAGVREVVIFADRAKNSSKEAYSGEQHIITPTGAIGIAFVWRRFEVA